MSFLKLRLLPMLLVLSSCAALCQATDPAARIAAAAARSSLSAVDARPWHLKLDVTLFDKDGKNPTDGTIEVWQQGANSKEVFTFGDSTTTRLQVGDHTYRSSTGPDIPYRATQVVDHILRPGPSEYEIAHSKPEQRAQLFGKLTYDCIMLSEPIKGVASTPFGLFPTYCLEPGKEFIRVSAENGTEVFGMDGIGQFLDHNVVTTLSVRDNKVLVATAKEEMLRTYVPQPDDFTPTPDMKPVGAAARMAGGVLAGRILKKVPPIYPESAKQHHAEGTVILRALIGRDGYVHSLTPITAIDPDLTLAAIFAVRQWTYEPYLLNGEPTDVDTTITVHFNLN
jgi:TonB family protein